MGSRDWWLYWNNCKQNIISLQDFLNWCHVYCTFAEIHAVSLDIKDVYYHDILDKKSWNSSDFFSKLFLNMGLLCSVGYYSLHTNVLEFSWRGYLLCWFEKKKIVLNTDIGADVLDQTGQDIFTYGELKEDPAYFELTPRQQEYLDFIQQVNDYLTQEYHAIQELLWRSNKPSFLGGMPPR